MDRLLGGYGVASVGFGFLMASFAFLRGMLPKELVNAVWDYVLWLTSLYIHIHIYESTSEGFDNQLYAAIESYLGSLIWERHLLNINVSLPKNASQESYELPNKERIADTFQGVTFWWIHYTSNKKKESDGYWTDSPSRSSDTNGYYTLRFHRKHKHTVVPQYLKHIREHAKQVQHSKRDKFIYTNGHKTYAWSAKKWKCVPFKHPATFESMAMEEKDKVTLINDLKKFMSSADSYKLAGRAWKRGYLLYGPPGTGKSSLVAAIANFTGYDVYDLELTEVKSNGELRKLLMDIGNKSVIVIEDIDCSIELKKRGKPAPEVKESKGEDKEEPRITLSGLLNFTDGLWSSCGSERIIIFTTNHVDQLDPALLRPGRMDVKLELSYATFGAFKVLARTYLRTKEHDLFGDIKTLLSQEDLQITPAAVAEILVQNGGEDDPEAALQGLIAALQGPAHKKTSPEPEVYLSLS